MGQNLHGIEWVKGNIDCGTKNLHGIEWVEGNIDCGTKSSCY